MTPKAKALTVSVLALLTSPLFLPLMAVGAVVMLIGALVCGLGRFILEAAGWPYERAKVALQEAGIE